MLVIRINSSSHSDELVRGFSIRSQGQALGAAESACPNLQALRLLLASGRGGLLSRVDIGVEHGDEGRVEPPSPRRLTDPPVEHRQLAGAEEPRQLVARNDQPLLAKRLRPAGSWKRTRARHTCWNEKGGGGRTCRSRRRATQEASPSAALAESSCTAVASMRLYDSRSAETRALSSDMAANRPIRSAGVSPCFPPVMDIDAIWIWL
jgi:hypothetical protein